ncbi:hypothetical protein HA050_11945 [Iodobacter sp. HSC-16F04]|uniref:Uncharacterized protein n=1 Tax=Iodobacter violaceini TaxID=3044271 RepID=A0ABX0KQH0_9NEIS|nr:hypothetical protein [Iodobacter violacea]NHQ86831.1 hypothetical protein [Iodobacter violacea]
MKANGQRKTADGFLQIGYFGCPAFSAGGKSMQLLESEMIQQVHAQREHLLASAE